MGSPQRSVTPRSRQTCLSNKVLPGGPRAERAHGRGEETAGENGLTKPPCPALERGGLQVTGIVSEPGGLVEWIYDDRSAGRVTDGEVDAGALGATRPSGGTRDAIRQGQARQRDTSQFRTQRPVSQIDRTSFMFLSSFVPWSNAVATGGATGDLEPTARATAHPSGEADSSIRCLSTRSPRRVACP